MKKIGSALIGLIVLVLLSGNAFADCESDCDGPFQTCVNICRQTTKEDSKEAASCMNNCFRGVSGCQKRCREQGKQSENTTDKTGLVSLATASFHGRDEVSIKGAEPTEQGISCASRSTPQ